MAKKFPTDEFDSVAPHGGRHRVRRTNRDRWFEFAKVLVVSGALASIAMVSLNAIENGFRFDATVVPGQSQNTSVTTGPGVTVLDASTTAGSASKVAKKLLDAGFNVLTADVADSHSRSTTIYISSESYQSVAKDLAKALGYDAIEVSSMFADPITVVIGTDYK